MKTKLLPCPFCGNVPAVIKALPKIWRAQCWVLERHMVNVYAPTKSAAIAAWNRRAKG